MPIILDAEKTAPVPVPVDEGPGAPGLYDAKLEQVSRMEMAAEEKFQEYLLRGLKRAVEGGEYETPPQVCEMTEGGLWSRFVKYVERAGDPELQTLLQAQSSRSRLLYDITRELVSQGKIGEATELAQSEGGRSLILERLMPKENPEKWLRSKLLEKLSEGILKERKAGNLITPPKNIWEPIKYPWDAVHEQVKSEIPGYTEWQSKQREIAEMAKRPPPGADYHPHTVSKDPAVEAQNAWRQAMPERFRFTRKHSRQLLVMGLILPGALGGTLYYFQHRYEFTGRTHEYDLRRRVPGRDN